MLDYIKKNISYYSYIVTICHQFIFEILWDYTVLLSCNQLSAQFSACVTKDQGPRSQRRNFQNRRFEKKGRFSKGRGPRRDAPNQSRNAGTKGRFQKAVWNPDVFWRSKLSNSTPKECPRLFTDGDSPVVLGFRENWLSMLRVLSWDIPEEYFSYGLKLETINLQMIFQSEFQPEFYTCLHPRLQNIASKNRRLWRRTSLPSSFFLSFFVFFEPANFLNGYVHLA